MEIRNGAHLSDGLKARREVRHRGVGIEPDLARVHGRLRLGGEIPRRRKLTRGRIEELLKRRVDGAIGTRLLARRLEQHGSNREEILARPSP